MELNLRDEPSELLSYARQKKYGKIASRLRAVAFYACNETVEEIVDKLGYCRQSICDWIHRYNANGIKGLYDQPRPGQPRYLSSENELIFKQRIMAGPKESDQISAFTGKIIISILRTEFNVEYSLSGVYNILERLKMSSLLPRPRHEKNNLEAMKKWEAELPTIVADVKKKSRKRNSSHVSRRKQVWPENSADTCLG